MLTSAKRQIISLIDERIAAIKDEAFSGPSDYGRFQGLHGMVRGLDIAAKILEDYFESYDPDDESELGD